MMHECERHDFRHSIDTVGEPPRLTLSLFLVYYARTLVVCIRARSRFILLT